MRVYLPASLPLLRSWVGGTLPAQTAYAVTPDLRAALDGADDELEAYAQLLAARASVALLGDEPVRVVLAAEAETTADLGDGAVAVGPVPWRAVAAGLVDGPGAAEAVRAGDADDHDLLWYATQELADL